MNVDWLPVLLSRLEWYSGTVRERTCVSLARLLAEPSVRPVVHSRLLAWLRSQPLENVAVLGILIALRARDQDPSLDVPSVEEITSSFRAPSILGWLAVRELAGARLTPPPAWGTLCSQTAPGDFSPSGFFTKYWESFLPPAFADFARDIERMTGAPFVRQWAYEWQRVLDRVGIMPSTQEFNPRGQQYGAHIMSHESPTSDVYWSAYLRALAWAVHQGVLSEGDACFFARMTCQIDLGLWRVTPSARPDWWPYAEELAGTIDTVPIQVWQRLDTLWSSQLSRDDGWVLAQASGRVHEGATVYDLEIYGIFQQCYGPRPAESEEIVGWYEGIRPARLRPASLCFEGTLPPVRLEDSVRPFGDWGVVPATLRTHANATPRWQWWRMYRDVWAPAPFILGEPLQVRCEADSVVFQVNGESVGIWEDWVDGVRERTIANLSPPTGEYLLVRRQLVDQFAMDNDAAFCWACRITGFHRKYDHEEYKTFADCRLYGARGIIIVR